MSSFRASRLAALLAMLALCAAILGPAPAAADPPTRTALPPDTSWKSRACGFPVQLDIAGPVPGLVLEFAGEGYRALYLAPGATVTLTNLDTGATLRVNAAGPAQLDLPADGSGTFVGVGTFVWDPTDPVTGEAGFFSLRGRLVGTVSDEEITDFTFTGASTNLCPALAADA